MEFLHKTRSIRLALTFWYAVILLSAFALFGAAVYTYLSHLQDTGLQQDLREEVDWISRLVDVERRRVAVGEPLRSLSEDVERKIAEHFLLNPRNYVVILSSSGGSVLYESGNSADHRPLGEEIPAGGTILLTQKDRKGAPMRVAARRDESFVIEVAYTQGLSEAVLGHLLSIFAILAPVVLLVAVSGGWVMAGIVLRPIRKSYRNMREFSLSIAHELKTPLTILKGESELALAGPLTPQEAQELASTYIEEASRLSRIVDDLLTLARMEDGQMSVRNEPVHLDRLMNEIHEDALILTSDKRIAVALDRNDEVEFSGDPVRLRQLLRALLTNAVRYTDPGGTIRLRSERKDREVAVTVEDDGIGIPPGSLERIFEPFYRVDEARSRSGGGSGLGLAVAKWIVEAHRGTIEVRSAPGKGSSFTVHLPLAS